MKRIKLITAIALASGLAAQPGEEIELPEGDANRLIERGWAKPVDEKRAK